MISYFASDSIVRNAVAAWLIAIMVLPLHLPVMLANPSGGNVSAGSAQITTGTGNVTVQQSSQRAIIRWNDFSVQQGETTTFVQPNSSSATLNRVTGGNASQINGALNANGKVYLVNPNGVVIGKTGRVNTGSFTASTHDVADGEFLNGGDMTFRGNSSASVINHGKIKATAGDVTLIARQVENTGKIRAKNGSVNMAGGTEVLLKPDGEQRVFIRSGSGTGSGTVSNSGSIRATAAELRAAGGNEYALAVNNSGVIRATTVDKSGGRIVLKAETGTVQNSGKLLARGTAPGKNGGSVIVTGDNVRLTKTSVIDAGSRYARGGEVKIGGGYQGKDASTKNARITTVEAGSVINVSGGENSGTGNQGGTAIVWSDERTDFLGSISARDGGFVEVSSKGVLNFAGAVDTAGGTLLLDPASITISSGLTTSTTPTISTVDSVLNATDLITLLASGNVTLQAANFIVVSTPVTSASGRNLTFNTAALYLNAPISLGGGTLAGTTSLINVYVNGGGLIQNGVDAVAAGGHVYLAAGTYATTSQVNILKSLTLSGTGTTTTTLDGGLSHRLFTVNPGTGGQVNISGIGMTRGRDSNGGALYLQSGSLALSNVEFNNNGATNSGGALFNISPGTLTLGNVTFQSNSAVMGGGVYNETGAGAVRIADSSFSTNSATSYGGAVVHNSTSSISLSGVTISNNTSTGVAGIYNAGSLTITGSSFLTNTGTTSGGALFNDTSGIVTIADSIFSDNRAKNGGAIANSLGTVTIRNSTFTTNRASANGGGAIYNTAGGTVNIFGSLLQSNSASSISALGGGAIFNEGATSKLNITDSILKLNSVISSRGGGIYNDTGIVTITGSTLDTNTSLRGSGIYTLGAGKVTITGSTLVANGYSSTTAGGVYNDGSTVEITGSTLYKNVSGSFGGGLYQVSGTSTITDSTLEGNRGTQGGGIYITAGTVNINSSALLFNVATSTTGGGILNNGTLNITNSTLAENTSTRGAGLYNTGAGAVATITSSTFSRNRASSEGNGIYVNSGTVSLHNSIVVGNNGAAVMDVQNNAGTVTDQGYNLIGVTNAAFSNTGSSSGVLPADLLLGPLGYYGGPTQTFTLQNGSLALGGGDPALSATSDQRGRSRSANLYSGGVDIGSFQAHNNGGEYYVTKTADDGTGGTLRFGLDATNLAEQPNYIGFKIPTTESGYSAVTGVWTIRTALGEFLVNRAMTIDGTTQAGYVPNGGKPLVVLDGNLTNRVLQFDQGAGVKATLDGLGITNGRTASAAGILINNGDVTFQNSSVYGNIATGSAGGIVVRFTSKLTLLNSTVADNSSPFVGGIYNNGDLIVNGSTFIGNIGGNSGGAGNAGAIYTDGSATITNSTFSDNQNAMVIGGGTVTVTSSTFGRNNSSAGSVYIYGGLTSFTFKNSIFANSAVDIFVLSGTITDQGYNIIESPAGNPFAIASTTIVGQDPGLSALGWYGGPTQTYGLLPGSIALDKITVGNYSAGSTDQRGITRGQGPGGRADIGAFESRPAYIVTTTADYDPLAVTHINGSLRTGFNLSNAGLDEGLNINFNIATSDKGYNPVTGQWTITVAPRAVPDTIGFYIGSAVTINGASQPGYSATAGPSIVINANKLGYAFIADPYYYNDVIDFNALSITNGTGDTGGALLLRDGYFVIRNSRIYNNVANEGGALLVGDAVVTINNTIFSNNKASGRGGAILNQGNITITDSVLASNFASSHGGAIWSNNQVYLTNSQILFNRSTGSGGGIYSEGIVGLDGSLVMGNSSAEYGGGLYFHVGRLNATNSTIVSNSALYGGGGIYIYAHSLDITGSTIASNTALDGVGGGVFVDYGSVTFTSSTIAGNNAQDSGSGGSSGSGGGIYSNYGDPLTLDRSVVVANTSTNDGGGIYHGSVAAGYGNLDLKDSYVVGNTSLAAGGGIANGVALTIDRSYIVGNTSVSGGGGIYANLGSTIPFTITNSVIMGNNATAGRGGGIYLDASSLTMSGSTVSYNIAEPGEGGGIAAFSLFGNTLDITNSTIEYNQSPLNYGAGLFIWEDYTATIENSVLRGNSGQAGAGISVWGNLNLLNSTVRDNTSRFDGGGVFITNNAVVAITGSTISGNTVTLPTYLGGGVQQISGTVTVTNSTIAGNEAYQGAGYFLSGGTLTLNSSTISRNTARDTSADGGAGLYILGAVSLNNTIIAGNFGNDVSKLGGSLTDNGYNLLGLIASDSALTILPTTTTGVLNPGLTPLGNYGGPTQTMALLPGSLALGKGDPALNGTSTDQRGVARNDGAPDIGAFESRGFSYTITGGNNQSTVVGTAFAQPLVVTMRSLDGITDFTGGVATITLTVPGSGPSAGGVLTQAVTFAGASGRASFNLTANLSLGTYNVAVADAAPSAVFFTLTNTPIRVSILANAGQGKTYGEADPLSFGYTFSGGAPGLMLNGKLLRVAGEDAGGYQFDIRNLGALNPLYSIELDPSSPVFTIRPALLTVTATDATGTAGQPIPTLGGTITGFQFADTASAISGLAYTTNATTSSPGGTYTITPGGAGARNYTFLYIPATLTLDASAQLPDLDMSAFNATHIRNNEDEDFFLYKRLPRPGYTISYEGNGKALLPRSLLHVNSADVVPTDRHTD